MSYEAWGDNDDGEDYDHLLNAGWWASEQDTATSPPSHGGDGRG